MKGKHSGKIIQPRHICRGGGDPIKCGTFDEGTTLFKQSGDFVDIN